MAFKRKKGICVGCSEERWIYAKKMCQLCYMKTKNYSSFKKKPKAQKEAYGYKNQKELFLYLWETSTRICPISKQDLRQFNGWENGNEFQRSRFYSMFAHILSKGLYGRYKLNPDNIMIVHPDIHTLIDAGTKEQRKISGYNFDIFYNKQEQLKKEYHERR